MALFWILIDVVAPVFVLALIGYVWAKRGDSYEASFVSLLVNNLATPALVLDSLLSSKLNPTTLGQMALGAALCMGTSMALGWLFVQVQGLRVSTYLPVLVWSNGGNMGLPLMLFAFGEPGLALAIAWFSFSAITNYTLGHAIAAGGLSLKDLVTMPMMWALAVVSIFMISGIQPPNMMMRSAHLLAGVSVPLMLLSLGHSLAKLQVNSLWRSILFACARMCGGFVIGWVIAMLLGFEGTERGVLIIQSSMPSAVMNYIFASRYSEEAEHVAGIVVVSTFLSVFLLPIFLSLVI